MYQPSHNIGTATKSTHAHSVQTNDDGRGRPFHKLGAPVQPLSELIAHSIKGYDLVVRRSFDGLDTSRISALLENSFGKKLVDPAKYFAAGDVIGIIVEKDYRGVAIVKDLDGVPYLDKLAVIHGLKGNGLGGSLWQALKNEYPSLIWRAAKDNPINPWYVVKSDGNVKMGGWNIYWYGFREAPASELTQKIDSIPKTLVKSE